jgi:UDP-glucose 4-epimerase
MTSYLVTGGTGNIGAFVTKELLRDGGEVVAYDLLPNRRALEVLLTPEELRRTTLVQGDVLDLERIVRTIKTNRIDLIAHLAAAGTDMCIDNPAHCVRTNVVGTNNMFEAALQTGVKRVFFASSFAVFGEKSAGPDRVVASDAPYDPRNVYGATKVMNEVAARVYTAQYGLETVGLRPTAYGPVPGGMFVKWVPQLIDALLRGRAGTAVGDDAERRWLYAEDTARAVAAALKVEPCPNTTLTLPIGFPASNNDVIEIIRRSMPGTSISVTPAPAHWQRSKRDELRPDGHLAGELLGWKPTIGVEEGIQKIIAYHRAAIAGADAMATPA